MPPPPKRAPPMLVYDRQASGGLPIQAQRFDAQHPLVRIAQHGHQFFEFIYVNGGRGSHRVGGTICKAQPGDLFVIAPGEVHDARGLAGATGWIVLFHAEALTPSAIDAPPVVMPSEVFLLAFLHPQGIATGRLQVARSARAEWEAHLSALEHELRTRQLAFSEAARARLSLLLIMAARLAAPQLKVAGVQPTALVAAVFRTIHERFADPISLADVARAVGRSPAYLTDRVHKETGRTVLGWITERRMAEARRLLLETDLHVGDIGEAVSYLDAAYFIRLFRRRHGATPQVWRKAQR